MRRTLLLTFLTLAGSTVASAQADSAAAVATVTRLMRGMFAKDTSAMRAELDSVARFTLLRPTASGDVRVILLTANQFLANVANPQGAAVDEPVRNARVFIDGDLASVWAEYQVRVNGSVTHCGHDAFHMVRRGNTWKILSIADSFRREGCGARW